MTAEDVADKQSSSDEKRQGLIRNHADLKVFQKAFELSMRTFEITKTFPKEETYSLTDQIRRSSRSVCANLAEAWRKRRYEAAFVSKLNHCETEAEETQVWIQFSVKCGYIDREQATALYTDYDKILGMLVAMIKNPKPWLLNK